MSLAQLTITALWLLGTSLGVLGGLLLLLVVRSGLRGDYLRLYKKERKIRRKKSKKFDSNAKTPKHQCHKCSTTTSSVECLKRPDGEHLCNSWG